MKAGRLLGNFPRIRHSTLGQQVSAVALLLERAGHDEAAERLRPLVDMARRDPHTCLSWLHAEDWWEGPGSLAVAATAPAEGYGRTARETQRLLREGVIHLYEHLASEGYGNHRGTLLVANLRKWNASGM